MGCGREGGRTSSERVCNECAPGASCVQSKEEDCPLHRARRRTVYWVKGLEVTGEGEEQKTAEYVERRRCGV